MGNFCGLEPYTPEELALEDSESIQNHISLYHKDLLPQIQELIPKLEKSG